MMRADERDDDPAADRDGEEEEPRDEEPGRLDELQTAADAETQRLQQGRTVSLLGNPVPVRVLIALGIFLVVFMIVWTALWALGGGLGLALGWIPAAIVGAFAIRVTNHTVWDT
jgi:hypothetical protein